MREGSMHLAVVLAAVALLLAPATGLAQRSKRVKPKPKAKPPVTKKAEPKPAPPKTEEVAEEKKHVIATPAPFNVAVARRMTAEDVKARLEEGQKITVIDTRSAFTGPMAKGAAHVPADQLTAWAKDLPKETMIVAYCT
jgi:hypothetical protein